MSVDFSENELEEMVRDYITAGNAPNYVPSSISGSVRGANDYALDMRKKKAAEDWLDILDSDYPEVFDFNFSISEDSSSDGDDIQAKNSAQVNLEIGGSNSELTSLKESAEKNMVVMEPPPVRREVAPHPNFIPDKPILMSDQPSTSKAACQALKRSQKSKKHKRNPGKKSTKS